MICEETRTKGAGGYKTKHLKKGMGWFVCFPLYMYIGCVLYLSLLLYPSFLFFWFNR